MILLSNNQTEILYGFAVEVCEDIFQDTKKGVESRRSIAFRVEDTGFSKPSGVTLLPPGWSLGREKSIFVEVALPRKNGLYQHFFANGEFPQESPLLRDAVAKKLSQLIYDLYSLHDKAYADKHLAIVKGRETW